MYRKLDDVLVDLQCMFSYIRTANARRWYGIAQQHCRKLLTQFAPAQNSLLTLTTLLTATKSRRHEACAVQMLSIIPANQCPILTFNFNNIDSTIHIPAFELMTNCVSVTCMQHSTM